MLLKVEIAAVVRINHFQNTKKDLEPKESFFLKTLQFVAIWKMLPMKVVEAHSPAALKEDVDKYLKRKYNIEESQATDERKQIELLSL